MNHSNQQVPTIPMQRSSLKSSIKVAIVGGTGYTGIELIRILANHPLAQVQTITSRKEVGIKLRDYFVGFQDSQLVFSEATQKELSAHDVVFYATPHEVAMQEAQSLMDAGVKVIDLSAGFRLKNPQIFEEWYKQPHTATATLAEAVYGISELERTAISKARLVANPGCYPTSIQLPLVPLIKQGLIQSQGIISDSKSGISGAGRGVNVNTLFSECSENFKAYGVAGHRHLPEINQALSQYSGKDCEIVFIPHLVPMARGIESTLYCQLSPTAKLNNIYDCWYQCYAQEPFVVVQNTPPNTKEVRSTNRCAFNATVFTDKKTLVISSAIDNLVKGASGQAVQNMNIMLGLDETLGLESLPLLA